MPPRVGTAAVAAAGDFRGHVVRERAMRGGRRQHLVGGRYSIARISCGRRLRASAPARRVALAAAATREQRLSSRRRLRRGHGRSGPALPRYMPNLFSCTQTLRRRRPTPAATCRLLAPAPPGPSPWLAAVRGYKPRRRPGPRRRPEPRRRRPRRERTPSRSSERRWAARPAAPKPAARPSSAKLGQAGLSAVNHDIYHRGSPDRAAPGAGLARSDRPRQLDPKSPRRSKPRSGRIQPLVFAQGRTQHPKKAAVVREVFDTAIAQRSLLSAIAASAQEPPARIYWRRPSRPDSRIGGAHPAAHGLEKAGAGRGYVFEANASPRKIAQRLGRLHARAARDNDHAAPLAAALPATPAAAATRHHEDGGPPGG